MVDLAPARTPIAELQNAFSPGVRCLLRYTTDPTAPACARLLFLRAVESRRTAESSLVSRSTDRGTIVESRVRMMADPLKVYLSLKVRKLNVTFV